MPQAGQASLFVFSIFGTAQYLAVNARTGSDYGLDFRFQGLNHTSPPTSTYTMFWGVPGAHEHDILRFPPGGVGMLCRSNPLAELFEGKVPVDCLYFVGGLGERNRNEESGALLAADRALHAEPDHLRGAAGEHGRGDLLRPPDRERSGAVAGDHRLRQTELQPEPGGGADDDRDRHGLGAGGRPRGAAVPGPGHPLALGDQGEQRGTAGRLLDQPERRRRQDRLLGRAGQPRHRGWPPSARSTRRSARTELQSSALPGPIFGYIYLGEPLPGDRWRVILTASGFATNVKLLGSARVNPSTGQVVTVFEDLPQTPFQEFNLHFFGSERGLFATPTQCGTYPVNRTFVPWAAELSDQTSTQYFTIDSGPGGQRLPERPAAVLAELRSGRRRQHGGRAQPVLAAGPRATTANRTSPACR